MTGGYSNPSEKFKRYPPGTELLANGTRLCGGPNETIYVNVIDDCNNSQSCDCETTTSKGANPAESKEFLNENRKNGSEFGFSVRFSVKGTGAISKNSPKHGVKYLCCNSVKLKLRVNRTLPTDILKELHEKFGKNTIKLQNRALIAVAVRIVNSTFVIDRQNSTVSSQMPRLSEKRSKSKTPADSTDKSSPRWFWVP